MRLPIARRVGSVSWRSCPRFDEGLEDVLLDGEIAVGHGGHRLAQLGHGLDGLRHAEVPYIVGGRFGAQEEVVAHVLLDRAVAIIAPDHRIRQVEVTLLEVRT
jgi:hypothetical protein